MESKSLLGSLFDEMDAAGVEENDITHVQTLDGSYSGDFSEFKRIIKDSLINFGDSHNILCQVIAVMSDDCYFSFNRFDGRWETFDLPYPIADYSRSLESFSNSNTKGLF
ncbi:hypothetical protein ACGE24_03930 [Corynebacterium kroppenstedtii]|uniref:hypothetical protein n=1 Tax=Corynebacterium sp. PCR 32 TaxID=3351342 RepID=UPI00309DBA9D